WASRTLSRTFSVCCKQRAAARPSGRAAPPAMIILIVLVGSLAAVAMCELLRPRRYCEFPTASRRIANIVIWLCNLMLAALVFVPPAELRAPWPLTVPGFVAGFLGLDLLAYWTHRAQHAVPLLWRLHALHHSDPDVDVTTSVRHHPGEYLIAAAVYWL